MRYLLFNKLKSRLRSIDWVYGLNTVIKAGNVRREYARTMKYYAGMPDPPTFISLLLGRCKDRLSSLSAHRELRLFFLGTDEFQDRAGILQALEQFGALTYFTRADGSYGQNHPGPDPVRRATNTARLLELFSQYHAQGRVPHIMLAQTWAGFVDPKALAYIRDTYGPIIINIGMDDRHQYWGKRVNGEYSGTYGLIPSLDIALTAAPECVDWYMKEGCPSLFFPEASDPSIFFPMPERPKIHDVSFVGSRYGVREEIVMALRVAGIDVKAYGSGWESGRLPTEEVPLLFAQSRIVLGVGTIGHCRDFYALKMRDFDGPMSGSLYLTHHNPDLRLVYNVGHEIVTYRSVDDCVRKVVYYLDNPTEREAIAAGGYRRAIENHTWRDRFSLLFSELRNA